MVKLKLDAILKERKISGTEFARRIGMPYSTFRQVKCQKAQAIRMEYIERFCRALECTPNDLFEIVEEKTE